MIYGWRRSSPWDAVVGNRNCSTGNKKWEWSAWASGSGGRGNRRHSEEKYAKPLEKRWFSM